MTNGYYGGRDKLSGKIMYVCYWDELHVANDLCGYYNRLYGSGSYEVVPLLAQPNP